MYTFCVLSETQPPEIIQGQSVAKIEVPAEAANSMVGFENTFITVNEGIWSYFANAFRCKLYSWSNLCLINTKSTICAFSVPTL